VRVIRQTHCRTSDLTQCCQVDGRPQEDAKGHKENFQFLRLLCCFAVIIQVAGMSLWV
jgi:hypothetical protein